MSIKNIKISNEGYIHCRSCFYSSKDILQPDKEFIFKTGSNVILGEIDSGVWGISYLLSMYTHFSDDFVLFKEPIVHIDNSEFMLEDICSYSCYYKSKYGVFPPLNKRGW